MNSLDRIDLQLLDALQHDASLSLAQLGEQTGARLVLRLHRYALPARPAARLNQLSLLLLAEGRYERLDQSDLCSGQPGSCQGAAPSQRARALLGLGGEVRLWHDRLLIQPGGHLLIAHSDTLPPGVSFVSATDMGVFAAGTVTWPLGNVGPGEAGIIPAGFIGTFEVIERVRKRYVMLDRA